MAEEDKKRYERELAAYVPPTEEELRARKEAEKQKKKENSVFNRPVKARRTGPLRGAAARDGAARPRGGGPRLTPVRASCRARRTGDAATRGAGRGGDGPARRHCEEGARHSSRRAIDFAPARSPACRGGLSSSHSPLCRHTFACVWCAAERLHQGEEPQGPGGR